MLAKIAVMNIFFGKLENSEKQIYEIEPIGDPPGKVWLGSLDVSHFWPSIVTGLTRAIECSFGTLDRLLIAR